MWFGQRRWSLAAAAFQAFHQQEAVVVQLLRIHQRNSIGDLCQQCTVFVFFMSRLALPKKGCLACIYSHTSGA